MTPPWPTAYRLTPIAYRWGRAPRLSHTSGFAVEFDRDATPLPPSPPFAAALRLAVLDCDVGLVVDELPRPPAAGHAADACARFAAARGAVEHGPARTVNASMWGADQTAELWFRGPDPVRPWEHLVVTVQGRHVASLRAAWRRRLLPNETDTALAGYRWTNVVTRPQFPWS